MKIILEGTAEELRNILLFGISQNIVSNDGSQFLCGDIAGRGHRQKVVELTKEHAEHLRNNTPHVNQISNIVREYSKRYSESLQGNLSDKAVEKISSIMALFVGASLAEATEVIEHVKNIVLNELPKHTEVTP